MTYRNTRSFICLLGIDGSGKTTHALALLKALTERGLNAVYVSPRSSLIHLLLPKKLRKWAGRIYVRPRNLTSSSTSSSHKFCPFRNLLIVPILIYALLTYLLTIRPLLNKNIIIICDHYFYDLLLSLFGERSLSLVGLFPRPSLGILLDLPVDQAFARMHDEKDRKVPRDFYERLRRWYLAFARQQGFIVMNSTEKIEIVHREILDFTIKWLGLDA